MNIDALLPASNDRAVSPSELTSASTHRRIELQSVADLIYLKNNVAHSARAKIDLHLPLEAALREGNTGVDGMRRAVEAGVDKYIEDTFAAAKQSISVNGMDAEKIEWEKEVPEEFEPFDTRLASRISALHSQIESLNLDLANRRRTAAQAAATKFRDGFLASSAALDVEPEGRTSQMTVDETSLQDLARLQAPRGWDERHEEIKMTWEDALAGLAQLKGTAVQAEGRGQKASEVLDYLEGR